MSLLRRFFPKQPPVSFKEKWVAGLSAAVAISLLNVLRHEYPGAFNDLLLASMGATAVLLFAAPHSPMAQPFPLVGGHLVSAFIGVLAQQWVPPPFAAGMAVGGAIIAMHLLGCLHPPGGATALYAVSGGLPIWAMEYDYVIRPVATSAALMLCLGLLIHRLRRDAWHYPAPFQVMPKLESEALAEPLATPEDIHQGLVASGAYLDVDEADLWLLFQRVEQMAQQRALSRSSVADLQLQPAETIPADTPLNQVWTRLRSSSSQALVVTNAQAQILGIITPKDAVKALTEPPSSLPEPTSAGTAKAVMSSPVRTLLASDSLVDAARLLVESEMHPLPVLDPEGQLLGLFTPLNLWSGIHSESSRRNLPAAS